jgi:hypothetical protein
VAATNGKERQRGIGPGGFPAHVHPQLDNVAKCTFHGSATDGTRLIGFFIERPQVLSVESHLVRCGHRILVLITMATLIDQPSLLTESGLSMEKGLPAVAVDRRLVTLAEAHRRLESVVCFYLQEVEGSPKEG